MVNKTRKRVEVSDSTLELLQTLADYYGHGDTKAALATLAKFGVPMLLGARTSVQTQIEPTASHAAQVVTAIANKEDAAKGTLAARLGFRYTKENSSPLVEAALVGSQRSDCVGRESTAAYGAPTDEAIAALASLVDEF